MHRIRALRADRERAPTKLRRRFYLTASHAFLNVRPQSKENMYACATYLYSSARLHQPNSKSRISQMKKAGNVEDPGIPLKDDPAWQKYFKMLSMGLPVGAVKNAMSRDGVDTAVLDLDPTKSLASQQAKASPKKTTMGVRKKKRVRRKKIYWNPIDPGQIKDGEYYIVFSCRKFSRTNMC